MMPSAKSGLSSMEDMSMLVRASAGDRVARLLSVCPNHPATTHTTQRRSNRKHQPLVSWLPVA